MRYAQDIVVWGVEVVRRKVLLRPTQILQIPPGNVSNGRLWNEIAAATLEQLHLLSLITLSVRRIASQAEKFSIAAIRPKTFSSLRCHA